MSEFLLFVCLGFGDMELLISMSLSLLLPFLSVYGSFLFIVSF